MVLQILLYALILVLGFIICLVWIGSRALKHEAEQMAAQSIKRLRVEQQAREIVNEISKK